MTSHALDNRDNWWPTFDKAGQDKAFNAYGLRLFLGMNAREAISYLKSRAIQIEVDDQAYGTITYKPNNSTEGLLRIAVDAHGDVMYAEWQKHNV